MIAINIDAYSAFAVIFNILCLEVAYDSMRLFYWYLHYIYDLILYLCIMNYTVCYLTGIFYAFVRQISMLFIDNKISVFCILCGHLQTQRVCRALHPVCGEDGILVAEVPRGVQHASSARTSPRWVAGLARPSQLAGRALP